MDREPPGSHSCGRGRPRSMKCTRFSPWGKLSAKQTDEGLMVIIKALRD
jgi:hypothetical protein